jgi:hypothetical protein
MAYAHTVNVPMVLFFLTVSAQLLYFSCLPIYSFMHVLSCSHKKFRFSLASSIANTLAGADKFDIQ